ncbi:transmembrane protein 69-like [Oratosquilla oratoria]|uniref:transmembrane protein 69-like n=1 Tax=Oratosquilla oratoria TaxID=337810 RepID=UPI003F75B954
MLSTWRWARGLQNVITNTPFKVPTLNPAVICSSTSALAARANFNLTTRWAPFHSSVQQRFREDNKTTAIALLDNVKQVRHSPTPALVLGISGLIPFIAAPVYILSNGTFMPDLAVAQLAYGASILSFLGGVRWGLTLPLGSSQAPDWSNLGYSVTPSLIAWLGLLASPTVGSLTVITGLAFAGYMDMAMWGYPTWFKGMRFCLTVIAILSLWTTLMCRFMLNQQNKQGEEETLITQE